MVAVGDTVKTFTGRLGRVRAVQPNGIVQVEIVARMPNPDWPRGLELPPITVAIAYLATDLTRLAELEESDRA